MRRAKEIIGLPVLTFDNGKKLETVKGILYDPEHRRLVAFLVDERGWTDDARVIPFRAVKAVGRDALVINTGRDITTVAQDDEVKTALHERKNIANLEVFTEDGRDLGSIVDISIDEASGEVKGYEVSGGFIADRLKGRHFVAAPSMLRVGEDVVYVPSAVGTEVEQQVTGGVQKRVEEIQTTGEELAEHTREAAGTYTDQIRKTIEKATEQVRATAVEQQKRFVVGRRTNRSVVAQDGTVIAEAGQTVTREMAEDAQQRGLLGTLVTAVGGSEARQLVDTLRDEATDAFESIRKSVTEFMGRTPEQVERRRIRDALGRPVERVILDQQDQVILNRGEYVTNRAIERARDAGVLDILLSSVSTGRSEPAEAIPKPPPPPPGGPGPGPRDRGGERQDEI